MAYPTESDNLLQPEANRATMDIERMIIVDGQIDYAFLERILIPVVNFARGKQNKKPVFVPKG